MDWDLQDLHPIGFLLPHPTVSTPRRCGSCCRLDWSRVTWSRVTVGVVYLKLGSWGGKWIFGILGGEGSISVLKSHWDFGIVFACSVDFLGEV